MKKLKLFFALFAMLALGVGNAWGAETLYKTALFGSSYNSKKVSSYTDTWTATNNGFTVTVVNANNNNNGWAYIKMGRKSALSVGSITTQNALDKPISKITMTIDAVTVKNINSIKLKTSTNGSSFVEAGTFTISKGEQSVTINNPTANLYYQIEVDCKTGSNGSIQISKVQYYATEDAGGEETVVSVPTFSVPEGTFYSPINVELSCSTADAEIHYTLDGSTPSSTSEKYTTAIAISETTTVKAIAVKDGLTDSEVATATYTKGETITSYDIDFETNALEAYVNWDFSNITITTTTIKAKAGTYYANTSEKASASIKTKEKIQYPGILTFSVSKETNNTTSSSWKVQVSENGSTWTDVKTLSATEMNKGVWKDHSVDLSDYENVYVQISYGGSTAIRAIDEISLAQGVAPEKYTLTINAPENGTLSVTKGGASVASGDEFKAGTSLVVTPTPATGYVFESLTVGGEAVELTDGTYTFNMPAADVTIAATFKENEKPAATLTLSKNGETEDIIGYKQDDKVTLPSITSDCVKEFVGWSADDECATEPEYKAGEEYTLASTTQKLYAVYATVGGGGEATASVNMATYATANSWGSASSTNQKQITINSDVKAVISAGGNSGKYYSDGVRIYQTESAKITISTSLGELKSVKFTFTNSNSGTLLYGSTTLTSNKAVEVSGTSAVFSVGDTNASEDKGQIRFTAIEVVYTGDVSYSNYSTTCVAALDEPVFSVEGGENEAKTITLTATKGTIYYTLDGSTPTASSEKYTTPIVLDECGEHTIKAIAISSDSESPVASATYTIDLPILANSETDPYTETEAVEVYNGGCYDGAELVYVKGTVKTATFYNSGTYTITLTNGFQFYKFYKDGSKTLFADGEINKGDVLVACGKLSKYNTTYQLAEGCYLVEHEPYTEPKTDISNTEATAYTVDQAFALITDVSSDLTKEVFVKGLVAVAPTSNPTTDGQMTYKISDNGENTGNVLTVYLGLNLNGEKFTSKNDVQQGDYVVVKGKLLDYNSTYELNKGNQLVQHKKAATISIADITMEVGETKTIAATITPDAAKTEVAYSIKAGSDDCITLSDNNITAKAEGTATIVATIATAAEYMGKTVEFKVTVTPKTEKTDVVILAELGGKWYAMKGAVPSGKSNQLDAIEVTYFNGILYNVPEEVKSSITWTRSVVDGKATFVNNGKYLKGDTDTDLTLSASVDDNCKWMWDDEKGYYTTNTSGTIRTFLYRNGYNFKNYGVGQAGKEDANGNYSGLPVVTAPVYATGDIVYTRDVTPGNYGTICLPYASNNYTGATFFEVAGKEGNKIVFDEVSELEAGKPYIFLAEETEIKVTQIGTAELTAQLHKSLQGTFTQIDPAVDNVLVDNYMVVNNVIKKCGANCGLQAYRAYFVATELESLVAAPALAPGVRRISMGMAGQNTATGMDQVQGDNVPTKMIINGQLFILRGEKMYDAQGKLVK